jgi:hypothetical protein
MRIVLWIVALSTVLVSTPGYGNDFCRMLGLDCILGCGDKCGCGNGCEPGCGCDVGCGADVGCCEPACGSTAGCCEPSCGSGAYCASGRKFAGQTWNDCCQSGPRLCSCTDAHGNCNVGGLLGPVGACGNDCGCGDACGHEVGCGCEAGCGAEVGCGCQAASGGGCCGGGGGDWFGCGVLAAVGNCLCGCSGCDSEFYWSEWHNDPPRCCDPCDHYGNWTGPGAGYRAPYDHPYAIGSAPGRTQYAHATPQSPNRPTAVARKNTRPNTPAGGMVRRPYTGPARVHQR